MKVLILGNGLLGSEIIKQTNWDYLSRENDNFNFCDPKSYVDRLSDYDTILNCVGYTNTYSKEKEKHREINYKGVVDLSDICQKLGKKLIHISTDYVYEYSSSYATEDDIPLICGNWYTYYKLLADEYIMLKNNNYLICRTAFKLKPFPYETAWIDQIGNFDYVDVISDLIIKLINKNARGLYNVGTSEKTIYQLALITNENVKEGHRPFYVPYDITMNIKKLQEILKQDK
jgi:dTDP-4-dehydrorhamnose reductase